MTIAERIGAYLAQLATRLRPGSLRDERIHLRAFLDCITAQGVADPRAVGQRHIEAWRTELALVRYRTRAGMKPLGRRTRYDRLAAVQRFFAWLVTHRHLIADPAARVERGRRGSWQPRNVLSEAEILMMLDAVDRSTPLGVRDHAILELLYATGLRRAELVALDLSDVDLTGGTVFVRSGKGGKPRLVPLGSAAREAITAYVTRARPRFLRSPGATALFLVSSRAGQRGQRLGASSVRNIVSAVAERAGIGRRVTPHMLRHAVATHLLRAGASIRHVQELLGHARIDTTEIYTHLDVTDLAQAHAKAHPRGAPTR